MKFSVIKLEELSGREAKIYSVILENDENSEFDKFVFQNVGEFKSEIQDILIRLKTMGNRTGARAQFFKLNEGKPGDGVCALYDQPDAKLRVYGILYGSLALIIGGGGEKNVRAWQDDPILDKSARLMKEVSKCLAEAMKGSYPELKLNENGEFIGTLEFEIENEN